MTTRHVTLPSVVFDTLEGRLYPGVSTAEFDAPPIRLGDVTFHRSADPDWSNAPADLSERYRAILDVPSHYSDRSTRLLDRATVAFVALMVAGTAWLAVDGWSDIVRAAGF